jgi:hypothetical protein
MIISELFEAPQQCPECGGISFSDLILAEKKDACYHKVKASAKVWPSAYASGRLVQCRKKGAANYGNKSESVEEAKDKFSTPQQQAELRSQMDGGGEDPDARDKYGNLKRSTSPGLGGTIDIGGVSVPVDALGAGLGSAAALGTLGYRQLGKYRDSRAAQSQTGTNTAPTVDVDRNLARDIATGRNVGGKAIPSLGEPGKVVTSKTADKALTKLGGKNVETTPGPTVKSGSSDDLNLDPVFDVPAYVRQGKPDPNTIPKPGTKPKIIMRPGETMDQAVQRTRAEQEFGKFLQGQGGQSFGGQGGPTAAQATSGAGQIPTIRLPNGQTIPDPYRLSPSGQYSTQSGSHPEFEKIKQKWDQQNNPKSPKGQRPWGSDIEDRPGWAQPQRKKTKPSTLSKLIGGDLEEASRKKREQPEVKYDDKYDAMVARVQKLAGIGPMTTVYDPEKRVYKNVPTAQQPKVQPKK